MKKYIVEFLGTFFLVLTVILTVNGTAGAFAPIAIGSILMVMIFAGGHISGGHFNPAVTLGVWIRGKCATLDVPGYIIGQTLGGLVAASAGSYLLDHMPNASGIQIGAEFDFLPGVLTEFIGTFAIVWVVLQTATSKGTEGNSFYGLAIGFTVMACAYALGGITGGAFNPAVATGVSAVGMTVWANFTTFLVGQLLAGACAALLFKFTNDED